MQLTIEVADDAVAVEVARILGCADPAEAKLFLESYACAWLLGVYAKEQADQAAAAASQAALVTANSIVITPSA